MKIYTRTGDDGTTGLLGGDRIAKDSLRIAAIGDVDELNAAIGLARVYSGEQEIDGELFRIQNWLFDLGSELACPPGGKFDLSAAGPDGDASVS
jgi:cob(I)alamin adenosyltransferase